MNLDFCTKFGGTFGWSITNFMGSPKMEPHSIQGK